ncbi:hypothetical protein GCM10009844_12370 [Nocardioides koreensis]|uniref:Uncharacterized protein n=1 Tax=Nocardioides koreensis TaxID=433651 RepID=A0ABP5LAW0_9ACTN
MDPEEQRIAGVADVVAHIVAPALEAVLRPDEVDAASVARRAPSADPRHWYAELELSLVGERLVDRVYESTIDASVTDWRNRLASNLQDFVAESRFGWGEWRPLPDGWD